MSPRDPDEARTVLDKLEEQHPDARIWLDYESPFQLLVATILAAQCTDERVNKVTPKLFEKYPTPSALADAEPEEVQEMVRSTGFYRRKTESIQKVSRAIADKHGGDVPDSRGELTDMSGVGRKTANVVLGNAFGQEAVAVDTHVKRVSRRIGLTGEKKADRIEKELQELLPSDRWTRASQLLTTHGRRICTSRSPDCDACPVSKLCDYYREEIA